MNFRMGFSVSSKTIIGGKKKHHWDFDQDCIDSIYHFGQYQCLHVNLWTWGVFPLVCVFSNFFPGEGFPGGSDVKESACSSGDLSLIPRSGRSPGEGNDNLLQYSCLGNPIGGGAWRAPFRGVEKSRT